MHEAKGGGMKKFLIKGFCFVCIGLLLLAIVNTFYIRTNGYRSLDDTYKYYLMPDEIEVANLGSSHGAYGLYYDDIEEVRGFNFALPGQGLYYDRQLLQKYSDRLAEGCVIIIHLSYFSFDLEIGSDIQNRWYYKFLGYGSVPNHKITEYVRYGLCPFLSASFNAKYLVKDKGSIDFDIFWIYKYFGIKYDADDEKAWRKDAQGFLDFYYDVTEQGKNEEINMALLEEIIVYCEENDFRPVLITTPFTKYYNRLFKGEIRDEFNALVKKVKERYGVTYIDYSSDPRISDQLDLFSDSNHLNDDGRKAFTKILLGDLGLI
jgi:hypothetical protein